MKTFLPFLLLFLAVQVGFSQMLPPPLAKTQATQAHTPLRATYFDPTGATLDTLFREKNSWGNGLLNFQLVEDYTAGNWGNRLRRYLSYNNNDQQVKDSLQGYLNNIFTNVSLFTNAYDTQDNRTDFVNYNWMNNAWDTIFAIQYIYTYNSNNEWEVKDDFQWQPATGYYPTFSTRNYFNPTTSEIDSLEYYAPQLAVWERVAQIYDITWHDFPNRLYDTYYYQQFQGGLPLNSTSRYSFFFSNSMNYVSYKEENMGTGYDTLTRTVLETDLSDNITLREQYSYNTSNPGQYYGEKFIHVYNGSGQLESTLSQIFESTSGTYEDQEYVEYTYAAVGVLEPSYLQLEAIVYPQPGNATLYLRLQDEARGQLSLQISDLTGRLLKQNRFPHLGGESDYPIYVSDLPAGSYLLEANLAEKRLVKRIVIR